MKPTPHMPVGIILDGAKWTRLRENAILLMVYHDIMGHRIDVLVNSHRVLQEFLRRPNCVWSVFVRRTKAAN
jgi:hypothetical protein